MSKFEQVTEKQLDTIYKKEPNIFKVRTHWADSADCFQNDYIYVLTTLTHDQLAYYLIQDYDLPVWSTDHGYSTDLTAGFRIERVELRADAPFSDTTNIYRELLKKKHSNSMNIETLVIMDPDKEKLAQDSEYVPTAYITETNNWEDSLKYLAALRDQEIKEIQEKHEQARANQQISDIINQITING